MNPPLFSTCPCQAALIGRNNRPRRLPSLLISAPLGLDFREARRSFPPWTSRARAWLSKSDSRRQTRASCVYHRRPSGETGPRCAARAEPIALRFETGRARLAGRFPELEDQLCALTWSGYQGAGSPDRANAMVWAMTELFDKERKGPRVRAL
jgi:hypothetical protein